MFNALAGLLAFFYDLWPSYGGSILLFTLAIMLVLTPLSLKSTRSMIRMQRVQPELKKLQTQYKGDREALNREMMAFYQANNINPFSSCLPLLLQMPVFLVLYRVLRGLTRSDHAGHFDPKYLSHDSALYQALKGATRMMSFGMDLSRSAMQELSDKGLVKAAPYFLMIAAVAGSAWYQQRQVQGRNPAANSNPQQQMIMKIMPFIFVPITISIPAALVIYFVVSNLVRIAQGAVIGKLEYSGSNAVAKTIVTPAPTAAVVKETRAKPSSKSAPKPSSPKASAPKTSARVTKPDTRPNPNNRNKKKRK